MVGSWSQLGTGRDWLRSASLAHENGPTPEAAEGGPVPTNGSSGQPIAKYLAGTGGRTRLSPTPAPRSRGQRHCCLCRFFPYTTGLGGSRPLAGATRNIAEAPRLVEPGGPCVLVSGQFTASRPSPHTRPPPPPWPAGAAILPCLGSPRHPRPPQWRAPSGTTVGRTSQPPTARTGSARSPPRSASPVPPGRCGGSSTRSDHSGGSRQAAPTAGATSSVGQGPGRSRCGT